MSWDKNERQEYVWPMVGNISGPKVPDSWVIRAPPKENWEWCFAGNWHVAVRLFTLSPPNALQRFLLKHLLGVHWRRIA